MHVSFGIGAHRYHEEYIYLCRESDKFRILRHIYRLDHNLAALEYHRLYLKGNIYAVGDDAGMRRPNEPNPLCSGLVKPEEPYWLC